MAELNLVKISLKVLGVHDKINILIFFLNIKIEVPGSDLEKLLPSSNEGVPLKPILNLPAKLPMIVKPKLFTWR